MKLPSAPSLIAAVLVTVLVAVGSAPSAHATFPGANGLIAFTHSSTDPETGDLGPSQIWVVNPDGTEARQLTDLPGSAFSPAWSADGKQLAFQFGLGIWISDADGSDLHRVTPDNGNAYSSPAFSPDGKKLALQVQTPKGGEGPPIAAGIYAIGVDGTDLQLLRAGASSPAWSPDGDEIAFRQAVEGASQIMTMNQAGEDVQQLTTTFRFHGAPDWTPDGRIAYVGNEEGDHAGDAYVINPDGTGQHRLHDNPFGGDTESLSWSPDGSRFAFSTYLGPNGGAPLNYRLHTLAADGTDEFQVFADSNGISEPAWQPLPDTTDTTPPSIEVPETITTNATSPKGAAVEFTVSAEDDLDPEPELSCAPASGSVFVVGSTKVECTAKDAASNSSAASFEIVVLGPAEQIQGLIAKVSAAGLASGLTAELISKLELALDKVEAGKPAAACNKLDVFISKVESHTGKKLPPAKAAEFIAAAFEIEAALGC